MTSPRRVPARAAGEFLRDVLHTQSRVDVTDGDADALEPPMRGFLKTRVLARGERGMNGGQPAGDGAASISCSSELARSATSTSTCTS